MLNTIGSLIGAESAGILSCVSYTAGVSGKDFPSALYLFHPTDRPHARELLGPWRSTLRSGGLVPAERCGCALERPHSAELS